MKRIVLALLATLVASSAMAGDFRQPPVVTGYNWTGFYLGANAGWGWGRSDAATTTVLDPVLGYFVASSVATINGLGAQRLNSNGFVGGAQAGYNWQSGSMVFGWEIDINSLGLRGSKDAGSPYVCCAGTGFNVHSSLSPTWLYTFRPRVGLAADNWLFYGTAGLAIAELDGKFTFTDTFSAALETGSVSDVRVGWTAGAGIEAGLSGGWTVKAEYLYVNLGTLSATSTNLVNNFPGAFPTNVFTHSVNLTTNIVRLGLNYRFGG